MSVIVANPWNYQLAQLLHSLLNITRKIRTEREKLQALYIKWCDVSNQTVESMLTIREIIMTHNLNSNIASLTGTSTAIVGSVLSIIGAIFAFPTAGLSLFLMAGGAATAAVGGAVSVGSVITRNVLSKQQCDEAKKMFSENISLTEDVEEQRKRYFDLLDQFKNELEAFRDQDILAIFTQLSELEDNFIKDLELDEEVRNSLPPTSIDMNRMKPRDIERKTMLLEHLPELIKLIKEDRLLSKLFNSHMLKSLAEIMKQLKLDTNWNRIFTTGFGYRGVADGGFAIGAGILKSGETLKDILKDMTNTFRIGTGILNSIFMIWGIVDLVMTSIDVHNGSNSNECEELLKVAEELKEYRNEVIRIMADTFEWHL